MTPYLILGDLDGARGQRAEVGGEAGAGAVPHVAPPQRRRRGRRRGGGDDGDGAAARALIVVPGHLGIGKNKHSRHWQCSILATWEEPFFFALINIWATIKCYSRFYTQLRFNSELRADNSGVNCSNISVLIPFPYYRVDQNRLANYGQAPVVMMGCALTTMSVIKFK